MGLGEYTWIYVVAYYSWLGHQPTNFALGEGERPRIFADRVLGEVRDMIGRQLETLSASPGAAQADSSLIGLMQSELEAMEGDPDRLPFAEGMPVELEASLEPFRERLERTYCAATSELDFMRTERGRLGHDHL